jgi:hypothetical protein
MGKNFTFDRGGLEMIVKMVEQGQGGALLDMVEDEMVTRQKQLSSTLLYGSGGLFSVCADDTLINASVNDDGFCSVIPWLPTIAQTRRQPAITALGNLAGGTQPADQCADPPGSDWRGAEIEWCLGRLRWHSPEYDRLDLGTRWCDKVPIFRQFGAVTLGGQVIVPQGTRIQNDAEWGAVTAAVAIRQELGRWAYVGNPASNTNMFRGLQLLINTGYTDLAAGVAAPALDSKIENYGGDCIGDPDATRSIYQYFDAVVQRIIQRARQAGLGRPRPEDMRIVVRTEVAEALYEYWACNMGACSTGFGTTAIGGGLTQVQFVSADWARSTADDLRRRSVLRIHGMDIPLITDDYMPFTTGTVINAGKRYSDAYILTLQISGMPLVFGEFQDFRAGVGDAITGFTEELYGAKVTDGGRFYVWQERTNTCFDTRIALKPRIIVAAPFLQGRITNI